MLEFSWRRGAGCLATGIALWLTVLGSVEWVYPACYEGESAIGVHGFPLPYLMWAGASLEYNFLPHVWLINIALGSGAMLLVLAPLWPRLGRPAAVVLGGVGVLVLVLGLGWYGIVFSVGAWDPIASMSDWGGPSSYWDLRPARFDSSWGYSCQPSPHWYQDR